MRVLVVGAGGREHALVQALQGEGVELWCAPGNAGIARDARLLQLAADDTDEVVAAVEREGIHFTVVGPEAPLVAGLVDALDRRGHLAFGPTAAAARLESSKAFAKQAMEEAGVPTARWRHAHTFEEGATAVAELADANGVVIKADGLAAGKGVTVADTPEQAHAALREIFHERRFGDDAAEPASAIVEERLHGREVSLLAICDGVSSWPLAAARDYKRIGDGDTGPNTGGMGAYSPVAELEDDDDLFELSLIVHEPIVRLMRSRGTPYHGVLYAGVILTADGPRVLEYNVRFGDPEAQALLPRLQSDLLSLLLAASRPGGVRRLSGDIGEGDLLRWSRKWAVTLTLASAGYPASSSSGDAIAGLDSVPGGVAVTHAGTARGEGGRLVTAGGRVLNVTALGDDADAARAAAYAATQMISFDGMQLRTDIAASVAPDPAALDLGEWLRRQHEDDPREGLQPGGTAWAK
jgi:phosphoribosylamine---glycine ligase